MSAKKERGGRKRARLRADKDGCVSTRGEVRRRDAWTRTSKSGDGSGGVSSDEQRRICSNGISVNSSKFHIPVCKFSFSPCSWPQMKNF